MQYNLSFLYAGVMLCAIIWLYAIFAKSPFKGSLPKWIIGFVVLSLFVGCVDIVDSVFIMWSGDIPLVALYGTNVLLYLLESFVPVALYLFVVTITGVAIKGQTKKVVWFPLVFPAVASALIVTTPLTGLVFSFDPVTHAYSYGALSVSVYVCALLEALCMFVLLSKTSKCMRKVDVFVLCLDVFLLAAFTIAQSLLSNVGLLGFGASIGSLALFLSFTNATELGDPRTGTFDAAEFRRRTAALVEREKRFDVTFVSVENGRYLTSNLGASTFDSVMAQVADELRSVYGTDLIYRFQGARYCVITFDEETTRTGGEKLGAWFDEKHEVESFKVKIEASVTALMDVRDLAAELDLEAFLDFLVDSVQKQEVFSISRADVAARYYEYQRASVVLDRALANDSLELHFQPIIRVSDGVACSLEALSRLRDEDGNYIPPFRFVEIAEDTGNINAMSKMQFRRLCRFVRDNKEALIAAGVEEVKYNISSVELSYPEQGRNILSAIERYGLDTSWFAFELTESAAYGGSETVRAVLKELHDGGCRIFMDDFGTGYANIATITKMPFDGVKIDMSLLSGVLEDKDAESLYYGLVDMIHAIGKKVVSEGVEREEELELLKSWGVDYIQGYYFSKPLPPEDYLDFIAERK